MGFGAEKSEQISLVSNFSHFLDPVGDICLVLIRDKEAPASELLSSYLGPGELLEAAAKSSPPAHRAWLLGRLAAKAASEKRWGLSPNRTEILKGPEGRPRLVSHERADWGGLVSISHTQGAAAALAADGPAGLDLEKRDRLLGPRTENWVFDPLELSLAAQSGEGGFPGPLALWCAREAASKAWGRPLLNHLQRIRVIGARWPEGRLTVGWLGPERWRAEVRLGYFEDYLLAVAVEK